MLFAHVLIGYLITVLKVFTRWWRARQSESWPSATATVVAKPPVTTADAAIVYTYYADGGFYSGTDEKPFFLGRSAKKYANQISKGSNLTVRVKPGDPKVSIIRDLDQMHSQ